MNVIFIPDVLVYFEDLVFILYYKKYFSFLEASKRYTEELLDDILNTLPERMHKPAPAYFDKYGKDMEYASCKKNKRTTWYVFFEIYEDTGEIVYLIRYIANNHTVAQYL